MVASRGNNRWLDQVEPRVRQRFPAPSSKAHCVPPGFHRYSAGLGVGVGLRLDDDNGDGVRARQKGFGDAGPRVAPRAGTVGGIINGTTPRVHRRGGNLTVRPRSVSGFTRAISGGSADESPIRACTHTTIPSITSLVRNHALSQDIFSGGPLLPVADESTAYRRLQLELLKEHFGHDDFLQGQAELIDELMGRRDVLAIIGTDGGTSERCWDAWGRYNRKHIGGDFLVDTHVTWRTHALRAWSGLVTSAKCFFPD